MKNVGIIGGTGYTGGELARILSRHPGISITAMTSRQNAGRNVGSVQTNLEGYVDIEYTESIPESADLDLVFVATPHGASMSVTPGLLEKGIKVVDLTGDYRFRDAAVYEKWYGKEHKDAENLAHAVYGLPEFYRKPISRANLVANPGCYATSAILACAPLVSTGLVQGKIFVDGKSGTSGAGMTPSPRLHHPACGEAVIPYGVGTHRHTPEIEKVIEDISKKESDVLFVPNLVPMVRGILSSCFFNLKEQMSQEELSSVFRKAYAGEPFVRFSEEPSIRAVVGSNHAQVGARADGACAVTFGVIDNLMKGASGQAVQCMNLMLGFKETEGLDFPGLGV